MAKILIVDDEPLIHLLYKRSLTEAGFELMAASNGVEALTLLARTKPDLILLDIMMPGKDGMATLRELRAHESTRDIPVIIITANLEYYTTTRTEAKSGGAESFLTKPCNPSKLLAEVQRVLATQPARK